MGHVSSTLVIAIAVWIAGAAAATRLGHLVDTASSLALIGFGGWIALSAFRDMRPAAGQTHHHAHPHHKDKGTIVETAFGEKMSGGVADIADGDDE